MGARLVVDLAADPPGTAREIEAHIRGPVRARITRKRDGILYIAKRPVLLACSQAQPDRGFVEGTRLRDELSRDGAVNINLLNFLVAHPRLIPASWAEYEVFAWGTIKRSPRGFVVVPYLRKIGGRWHVRERWIGDMWSFLSRAAMLTG
jgi:hypothetical protein